MTKPIEKSIHVPLPPRDAFDLFTARMAEWWPLDSHSLSARDGERAMNVTVDPRIGGKIVETKADGDKADWATITAWEPGQKLAFDWYVGRDPAEATCVSVRFLPEADGTRVDLTHGGFERLGATGTTMAKSYDSGWDLVLGQCYGGAARAATRAYAMFG